MGTTLQYLRDIQMGGNLRSDVDSFRIASVTCLIELLMPELNIPCINNEN